jgi:ABC-type multidrug transport system fused ATPase/permease subunit
MKKIIKILFFIYPDSKKKIIKFVIFSLLATILEIASIGSVYPFMNIVIYKNDNLFLEIFNLNLENKSSVIILCSILFLIFILKNIYTIFFSYWQNSFVQNLYKDSSLALLNSYLSKKYSFFYINSSSKIINNINIETKNFAFAAGSFLKLLSEILVIISILFFLIFFETYITLYLLLFLFLFLFLYKKFIKNLFSFFGEERTKYSVLMLRELKTIFDGIKIIKIMSKENYFIKSFKKYAENFSKSAIAHLTFSELPRPVFETVCIILILVSIIFNSVLNQDMQSIMPILAVFIIAALRVLPGFNKILTSYQNIIYSNTTINIVYNEVENKYENIILDKYSKDYLYFNKSITISNLNFNYEGKNFNFFEKLDLRIDKNDFVGIIGKSGSGKSTLINLISCLYNFNNGYIKIDNFKIDTDDKIILWKKKIGYVTQSTFIKEGTVKGNIAFGVEENEINNEKVIKAMKEAELENFLEKINYNLNSDIHENGLNLSLGEQQRFGIARALYNESELFILDEPTSSLDKDTEEKFIEFLNKFSKMKTIILISHKFSNMKSCNKIFEIKQEYETRRVAQVK